MTRAATVDWTAAVDLVDKTQGGLYRALRVIEMMDAISRVCEEPDTDVSKEDLQAIFRGLTIVLERLDKDVATANDGVETLWHMVRLSETHDGAR